MFKKIYIVTGEKSGEIIGFNLLKNLIDGGQNCEINGIFGENIQKLTKNNTLFHYSKISVIGFIKPLLLYFYYKNLVNITVKDIVEKKPDCVVFVDAQGFTKHVVDGLKKYNLNIKLIKYVAPTFWIYSEHRKFWLRDNFFANLCFFPNEVEELNSIGGNNNFFVLNPHIENLTQITQNQNIPKLKENLNDKIFLIVPGSRESEIKKCLPIFLQTIKKLNNKNIKCVIPAVQVYEKLIKNIVKKYDLINQIEIVINGNVGGLALISDFCFCCSGTASLEVIAQKTPLIVCYKASPITFFIINKKRTNKSKKFYVNIINIIKNKMIVPELVNNEFVPKNLVKLYNKMENDYNPMDAYNVLQYLKNGNEKTGKPQDASKVLKQLLD